MRCNSSIFKAENYTIEHNMGNFDGKNVVYIWYLHCREECQILKPNKTFSVATSHSRSEGQFLNGEMVQTMNVYQANQQILANGNKIWKKNI